MVFVCAAVPVCFIFKDYISSIFSRFVAYDGYDKLLSKITTGRSDIWAAYLKDFSNSVWKVLFGVGLLTTDLISKGPHNVFVYILYRVGILGVVMIIALVALYIKHGKGKFKINLNNVLLFAVYLFFALEELVFSDRFFLFLVFGVMLFLKEIQEDKVAITETVKDEKQEDGDLIKPQNAKNVNKIKKNS